MFGAVTSTPWEQFPDIVNLNVGGVDFTTRRITLMKERGSNLAAMFSGRQVIDKDSKGRYFIDCNGGDFEHILNFLRSEQLPPETKAVDVYRLARQFGISSLQRALEDYKSVSFFKKIDDIVNGPMAREYQTIKESATKELKSLGAYYSNVTCFNEMVHTGNDIALNIVSTVSKKQTCQSDFWTTGIPDLLAIKKIDITVDVKVTEELAWCLAEELCMIGYGQYAYNFERCCCRANCGEPRERVIVLSNHQYERTDYGWRRV